MFDGRRQLLMKTGFMRIACRMGFLLTCANKKNQVSHARCQKTPKDETLIKKKQPNFGYLKPSVNTFKRKDLK